MNSLNAPPSPPGRPRPLQPGRAAVAPPQAVDGDRPGLCAPERPCVETGPLLALARFDSQKSLSLERDPSCSVGFDDPRLDAFLATLEGDGAAKPSVVAGNPDFDELQTSYQANVAPFRGGPPPAGLAVLGGALAVGGAVCSGLGIDGLANSKGGDRALTLTAVGAPMALAGLGLVKCYVRGKWRLKGEAFEQARAAGVARYEADVERVRARRRADAFAQASRASPRPSGSERKDFTIHMPEGT